jgi:hypothetical protein
MSLFQRILLMAALTALFVAAGVGWVQSHLSPVAESSSMSTAEDANETIDLPPACLNELASMESASAGGPSLVRSSDTAGVPERLDRRNVLRPRPALVEDDPDRQLRLGQEEASAVPARPPLGSDATARPIASIDASRVQSAEWVSPSPPSRQAERAPRPNTATLPVSVEETLPSESLDSLRTVDVLDLMRRLRSDVESARTPARRELLRRGFSDVDLELARQLFSPDAAVRKQLALAVPRLASVNAAQWLMWLAADPLPEVRRTALTTLATTGDPSLLDRIEELARKDSDQQIQALADQIAKQREMTARGGNAPRR